MSDLILVIGADGEKTQNPGGVHTIRVLLRHIDYNNISTVTVFFSLYKLVLQFTADEDAFPLFGEITKPEKGLLNVVLDYIANGIGNIPAPETVSCIHFASHASIQGIYGHAGFGYSEVTGLNDYFDLSTSPPKPRSVLVTIRDKRAPGFYVKIWGCNVFHFVNRDGFTDEDLVLQIKLEEALPAFPLGVQPLYAAVAKHSGKEGFNIKFAATLHECSYKERGQVGKAYFLEHTHFAVALSEALDAPVVATLIGNSSEEKKYTDKFPGIQWSSLKKKRFNLFTVSRDKTIKKKVDVHNAITNHNLTIGEIDPTENGSYLEYDTEPKHNRILRASFNETETDFTVSFEPYNHLVDPEEGKPLELLQLKHGFAMKGISDVFEKEGILVEETDYFVNQGHESFFDITEKYGYPGSGYFVYDWNVIQFKSISSALNNGTEAEATTKAVLGKAELLNSGQYTATSGFLNRSDYLV
ncbi:MAG: hypothetical protein OEL83_15125 [Desulforhopalus sp.]|nr:hypothetical protein [Desulforhopalus sp.]